MCGYRQLTIIISMIFFFFINLSLYFYDNLSNYIHDMNCFNGTRILKINLLLAKMNMIMKLYFVVSEMFLYITMYCS
jgi:hypothetical protein